MDRLGRCSEAQPQQGLATFRTNGKTVAQLSETQLQDVRFAVASFTATALVDAGSVLLERGNQEEDPVALGLAILASMSGETGLAAFHLYGQENWYAGAALTRQLVEHHHLFAYFSEDTSRVNEWLNADERELKRQFAATKLREAGGFTNADYRAHCTWSLARLPATQDRIQASTQRRLRPPPVGRRRRWKRPQCRSCHRRIRSDLSV